MLRYTVSFEDDPMFSSVHLVFRKNGPVDPSQGGLTIVFVLSHFTKLRPGVYDVDGTVPSDVATGKYDLVTVDTTIAPTGSKSYDASKFNLAVSIENDQRYDFPPLKAVTPK